MATLQPKAQAALLAAHAAPDKTLRRVRGGYAVAGGEAYTRRVINWLDNAALVTFDDPDFPHAVTLNHRGIAHAQQLLAQRAGLEKAS